MVMRRALLPLLLLLASSCATMMIEPTQDISVGSEPAGATVTVDCGSAPLYGGETPVSITLERKANPCALTIAKEGFVEQHVALARELTCPPGATYVGVGTLALIGVKLVTDADDDMALCWALTGAYDRHTGAAYKHTPGRVFIKLQAAPSD
jgi:hypothetical protein